MGCIIKITETIAPKFKMKVIALFATVNAGVLAFTPQASPRLSTKLEARRDEGKRNNFVGGALAFVAGIATAGQVAFADPAILMDNTIPAGRI